MTEGAVSLVVDRCVLVQGMVGVRTPLPRFASMGGEAVGSNCMVTWQGFARGQQLGHLLLLLTMRSALAELQQACPGPAAFADCPLTRRWWADLGGTAACAVKSCL